MIYLVTGVPGSGKTLYAVGLIKNWLKEGRTVFVDIKGWDHEKNGTAESPSDWRTTPEGSVVVYDECQGIFPSDGLRGRPNDERLTAMEMHRHSGHDLLFITQAPTFVHAHIRKLVGKHYHVYRAMGLESATVYAWDGVCDQPNDKANHRTADIQRWSYPKEDFTLYKSATLHTHKFKLPKKFLVIGIVILAFIVIAFFLITNTSFGQTVLKGANKEPPSPIAGHVAGEGRGSYNNPLHKELAELTPTTMAFSGCIAGRFCRCFDLEGNQVDLLETTCRDIAEGNIAMPIKIPVAGASERPDKG